MEKKLGTKYTILAFGAKSNKALMKELKRVLAPDVTNLRLQLKMSTPPFDPSQISKVGNAKVKFLHLPRAEVGGEGSLEVSPEGFVIKIDETLGRFRLRSTMAHELMHTFFYDVARVPPTRLGHAIPTGKHHLMEEELCRYLAREFLVPAFSIHDLVTKKRTLRIPSVANIDLLKSIYVVSSDILAYRMISDLAVWEAIFVKFVKEGSIYRSETQVKSKLNPLYRKLRIPAYVPQDSTDMLSGFLSKGVVQSAGLGQFEDTFDVNGHILRLDSKIDSAHPLSVITITRDVHGDHEFLPSCLSGFS
jgi:Zn-dependent peptidase ImmA (M78 family)